jgi:hypothetical protein
MARLKKCPDCGSSISRKAAICPRCGRPFEVKHLGCFTKVLMLGMAGVLGAIVLSIFSDGGRHRQEASPAPEIPQASSPQITAGVSRKPKYQPGAEVELVGPKGRATFLCSDEAIFMDRKSTSRQFVPGKDVFMVRVSERARVLEDKGDRLQVRVLEGSWKDRVGWIASDEVRLRPSPEEESGDVVEGLALDKRREIYAELHRVGMLATFEAEHQVPLRDLPAHPSESGKVLAKHKAVYEAMERKGRQSLIARYRKDKIDHAHLDRIDKEGTEKRWPLPEVADPYKQ